MSEQNSRTGRTPRIGRPSVIDLSPAEQAAREKANVPLDADLTPDEIVAREAEKAAALAQANAAIPAEPEPPVIVATPLGARLDQIAAAQRDATKNAAAGKAAEADALARGLLVAAHGLATKFGLAKKEHKAAVAAIARRPWEDILRAVPQTLEYAPPAKVDSGLQGEALGAQNQQDGAAGAMRPVAFVSPKFFVSEFARVARELDGALSNEFTDLAKAAGNVEAILGYGIVRQGKEVKFGEEAGVINLGSGTHDPLTGQFSREFARAIGFLHEYLRRAQQVYDTAVAQLGQLAKLQEKVEPILANVVPVPAPPKLTIPNLPTPPAPPGGSSYQELNMFAPNYGVPTPKPSRTIRMGEARESETKVIGVTGGA
jgi:hypothetical protein